MTTVFEEMFQSMKTRMAIKGQMGVGSELDRWWSAVNLMLEKREQVSMGGKGRGDITSEIGKDTGLAADEPTMYSLGKRYGWCGGLGYWNQKCFQGRLREKEATSATRQKH